MQWKRFWERLTNWEQWPFALRYALIAPVWAWYCIRSGSVWFFSPSNPTITFGGFEGEGKREMYDLLPTHLYPKTIYIAPKSSFDAVLQQVQTAGFTYPFCVKPDVGMKGLLFRKIDTEEQLRTYHQAMPVEYVLQDLVVQPLEVSVFYYRYPNEQKGVITGFIQKELMEVVGDGRKTLLQLIREHPKARFKEVEMRTKHAALLHTVLPANEIFFLTYAANLNRGARFTALSQHIDDRLLNVFDQLSHQTHFYYGRYDIKCQSIDDLKEGRNFSILEFNGAGAEPNHVYNQGMTLLQANKEFLYHWKVLYRISKYNHRNGHPYWSFSRGWRYLQDAKKHFKQMEELDTVIPQ